MFMHCLGYPSSLVAAVINFVISVIRRAEHRIGANSLGLAGVHSCAHISLLCVLAVIKAVPGYPFLDPAPPDATLERHRPADASATEGRRPGFRRPPPLTPACWLSG